jgi:hypothetical protein
VLKKYWKKQVNPRYDPVPFTITKINHSMITATRGKESKTRNSSFFIHHTVDTNGVKDRLLPKRVIIDDSISRSTVTTNSTLTTWRSQSLSHSVTNISYPEEHLKEFEIIDLASIPLKHSEDNLNEFIQEREEINSNNNRTDEQNEETEVGIKNEGGELEGEEKGDENEKRSRKAPDRYSDEKEKEREKELKRKTKSCP